MKVWIDLANSPHVLLFAPIIEELRRRGAEVRLTAREFAQTTGLARLHGLDVETVGGHGGSGSLAKGRAIAARALALRAAAGRWRPDLAVSHNSYSQCLAARSLGLRCVTLMDYEHTPANHIAFRLANRILLPRAIDPRDVRKFGATPGKIASYDGFKEQVYLESFAPERFETVAFEGVGPEHVLVVARPPADFAIYHRFRNPLFETWLAQTGTISRARIVVLPRTSEQRDRLSRLDIPSLIVPVAPLDGAALVHRADLVVSAGGTMNREAAVLGVPAYSVFAGRTAAVDRALEALGRLTFIRSESDLARIVLAKKPPPERLRNPDLLARIVDRILEAAN